MKILFVVATAICLLIGGIAILNWLESRGLIKPGTTRRMVTYNSEDSAERRTAQWIIIGICLLSTVLGLVVIALSR